MKILKWILKIAIFVALLYGSFTVGNWKGIIQGFGEGVQVGALLETNIIKDMCDTTHTIYWEDRRYYCAPSNKL